MNYIGQSGRMFRHRIAEHRGYIVNKNLSQPAGEHFNQPGHSLSDLTVSVIEQVRSSDILYREEREHYFIRKFNTFYNGLNKQK